MEFSVRAIALLTPRVKTFDLAPAGNDELPAAAPGAHVLVRVRDRMGMPYERAYALCHRPGEGVWRIAVQFEPEGQGGSRFLHETVRVGDRLQVSWSQASFGLAAAATEHVLIAQGIGIAPILAMAYALAARRQPFAAHVGGETGDDMPLAETLRAVAKERAHLYTGAAMPLAAILGHPQAGRHAYVCGPDPFIAAVREAAAAAGWPAGQLHIERLVTPEPRRDDRPVEVVLARSGRSLTVPADRSILAALTDAGLSPPCDCRRGACGTCVLPVIEAEGGIDHRDRYLTAAECDDGKRICVCVSRPKGGRLVLDF